MNLDSGVTSDAESGEQSDGSVDAPVEPAEPVVAPVEDAPKSATFDDGVEEAKAFIRWLRKWGQPDRPYRFQHLPAAYADTLNKFVEVQDFDGARWYAERYCA